MKASLLLILVAFAVAGAGTAHAQVEMDSNGSGTATAPPGGDTGSAATPGGWLQLESRPLVVPKGKLAVDAILPLFGDNGAGSGGTQLGAALQFSGTYGVIDNLELGADFSLVLAPSFDAGILGLRGAYAVVHTDKLDFAAAAELNFGLNGGNTVELDLGGWFRYRIANKMMLFTGEPTTLPLPVLGVGLGGAFLTGPVGYQLGIGFNNGNPIDFALPVGFGYQALPNLWVYGQLTLMNIFSVSLPAPLGSSTTTQFIFADFIPLTIGGYYTINDKMEAGLSIGDDFEHAGNFYAFTFNFRYWVK